jgi:Flp pilus assembly protein TadD
MQPRKLIAIALLLLSSFAAQGVNPAKSELESMYDKAFTAFNEGRYNDALKALDAIDRRQPDLAESLNLRGVVYMRQGSYEKAEAALRKALSVEPRFWNASFNLAEIPFLQKNWLEARNRFEALVARESEAMQPETSQLIQYKILLTFVLQGKENTVDWMLNKFELTKHSPALYYSNAAIAFQHHNEKEAGEWIAAARKQFSAPLNQLYAESFYEVGWMERPTGETHAAVEITSTAERAERLKADAKANFEKAERAFQARDFEGALQSLDLAEAGAPNDAAALNLRGEILMEQKKFEEAEVAFHKALAADPKFREAQYNLAQIPLKNGDYAKSRDRFEALFAEAPGGEQSQPAQLIKFKIFMTLLLEGKSTEAQQLMDQFKFTGETPALYYAQAAWEFKNGRAEQGKDWVASARKIYPPALNIVFADSFYDLGWLDKTSAETAPATSALTQAEAAPTLESLPPMRFGQGQTIPAPALTGTNQGSPAPANPATPSAAGVALAAATAISSPTVAPKATARPTAAIVEGTRPTASATISRGSGHVRRSSQPAFAEVLDRISDPRSLLVGGLLLGSLLFLCWLVVQQFRRNRSSGYHPSTPLTEPPLPNNEPETADEHVSRGQLASGPPKVSLHLIASEPSARHAISPSRASTARGSNGTLEQSAISPNDVDILQAEPVAPGEGPDAAEEQALMREEPVGQSAHSSVETPSFASKIISTESISVQPTTTDIMPETTTIAPSQINRPLAPPMSAQPSLGAVHTAVQLTFSLEIASMQLSPTFKMSGLQLKPTSKVVSMRLAPSQDPQPPINLQLTFEIAKIELSGDSIGTLWLAPSAQQKPAILTSPSFAISGLELVSGQGTAPVQLTPSHQEQASVHLTAEFQITAVEFTPLFEIAAIVLKATSKKVSMELPGSGPRSVDSAPVFEIDKVELTGASELGLIQVTAGRLA